MDKRKPIINAVALDNHYHTFLQESLDNPNHWVNDSAISGKKRGTATTVDDGKDIRLVLSLGDKPDSGWVKVGADAAAGGKTKMRTIIKDYTIDPSAPSTRVDETFDLPVVPERMEVFIYIVGHNDKLLTASSSSAIKGTFYIGGHIKNSPSAITKFGETTSLFGHGDNGMGYYNPKPYTCSLPMDKGYIYGSVVHSMSSMITDLKCVRIVFNLYGELEVVS